MEMLIAAVSAAGTPKIRNQLVVPLRLPRNYVPAALPAHPLSEELRVGVVLPPFDRARNATWTEPVEWVGHTNPFAPIPQENVTAVEQVFVNVAEPVAGALPKILLRLFPQAEILSDQHCPTCDVVLLFAGETATVVNSRNSVAGMTVTLSMTAVDRAGVRVATFSGESSRWLPTGLYWSTQTHVRGMGDPALRDAMEHLIKTIVDDAALKAFVERTAAERARPSDLETTVGFDDAASFFPNGRLDAGERAKLHCTIRNNGTGPAFAVRLRIDTATKTIGTTAETQVGDVASGGTRELDVPLSAGVDLETARQQLHIETLEKRGYGARPVILELATERLKAPSLEIADVRLEDRGERTGGDGDGGPSNGETLEAVILMRNRGPGEMVGALITISATAGVEVADPSMVVSAIAANAVKEIRTLVRVPITFGGADIALMLHAVETRGAAVASADKEQRWPVRIKKPQIEVAFRLFDGNSPRSRGNRDGVANNGETLEVALIPANRGALVARNVRLQFTSSVAGMTLTPASIDVGDLPPLAEGAEQRLQVIIPRAVDSDAVAQRLPLVVHIAQEDFPVADQLLGLPFNLQRPELTANVITQPPLQEGKAALFTLDIRNQGPLSAEDVKVDVSSDNPAVELLDASGIPAHSIRIGIGSISAEKPAGRIQFRVLVRRNASALAALLKIFVSQRDFATVAAQTAVSILKEEAALISAPLPSVPEAVPPRGEGVSAAVSFQRYRDGARVTDETLVLSFEVQSQTPIESVRLEQNHRVLELPQIEATRNGGTYLWQYEPRVQLEYGANDFEVVTITSEGVRSSRSMTVYREKPRGKIWLAVVGISNYGNPAIADLDFAKDDAVAIRAYYQQLGVSGEQVIELLDEEATLANVKRSLGTELVKHAVNPDDTVLIYFAGHGQMEADRSSGDSDGYSKYLLLHDANPADLFGSALSMEELSRILQRLRADRVVLIIDSCFSGAAGGRTPFEPNAPSRSVISEEFLSRMANVGKGRVILTASGSREVAEESSQRQHGIFTYFLLEGLRGAADTDHDGRVDVDELYKYVSQKVSLATRGRQNPTRKSPNLTGTLVLGGRLQ